VARPRILHRRLRMTLRAMRATERFSAALLILRGADELAQQRVVRRTAVLEQIVGDAVNHADANAAAAGHSVEIGIGKDADRRLFLVDVKRGHVLLL